MLICIFSVVSGGLEWFQVVSPVDPFARCCSVDTFFLISSSQRAGVVHISDTADQVKGKAKTSWKLSQRNWKRQRADAGRRCIMGACSSTRPNRESKQTRQTNIIFGECLSVSRMKLAEEEKRKGRKGSRTAWGNEQLYAGSTLTWIPQWGWDVKDVSWWARLTSYTSSSDTPTPWPLKDTHWHIWHC